MPVPSSFADAQGPISIWMTGLLPMLLSSRVGRLGVNDGLRRVRVGRRVQTHLADITSKGQPFCPSRARRLSKPLIAMPTGVGFEGEVGKARCSGRSERPRECDPSAAVEGAGEDRDAAQLLGANAVGQAVRRSPSPSNLDRQDCRGLRDARRTEGLMHRHDRHVVEDGGAWRRGGEFGRVVWRFATCDVAPLNIASPRPSAVWMIASAGRSARSTAGSLLRPVRPRAPPDRPYWAEDAGARIGPAGVAISDRRRRHAEVGERVLVPWLSRIRA